MFGFLKRRVAREHMKLMYQNNSALAYVQGFYGADTIASFKQHILTAQDGWNPGDILSDEDAEIMLEVNREFRRLYDATPAKYLKSFDDEFVPILGWSEFYEQYI